MKLEQLTQLHPLELRVLLAHQKEEEFSASTIEETLSMVLGQANQAISWLTQKNLIQEVSQNQEVVYEITSLGKEWKEKGMPAERLLALVSTKSVTLAEAIIELGLDKKNGGSAFGILSKNGKVTLDEQKQIILKDNSMPKEILTCITLLQSNKEIAESSLSEFEIETINLYAKKRGVTGVPFRKVERETIIYTLTHLGCECIEAAKKLGMTGKELGQVSPNMLKTKSWVEQTFRPYNITMPPNRVNIGRRNPYSEFLQQIKDKLVSLGFEEFDGPLVETEFWNSDALFMPQFHAARNIHDVYYIQEPQYAKEIEEPWLSNVATTHENGGNTGSRGWNYSFDKEFTRRLILRSQGTVMSAKTLTKAKIPGKYFGVLRVFRHDQIDATHLSDFYQTEGIILGDDVNIKTLLGLLKVFAEEFAHAEEIKYVPGYFPFTEPSIEVHIKHPKIGWMELGGSGILRPEVTKSLGIHVPVAAWGIGIDRMATMQMKINDLRDLFSNDLEKVSLRKRVNI